MIARANGRSPTCYRAERTKQTWRSKTSFEKHTTTPSNTASGTHPFPSERRIALIHSELSEALEEERAGNPVHYYPCNAGGLCVDDRNEEGITCGSRIYNPEHPDAPCSARSKKPEGVAVELADAVIRIADLCGHLGIDLDAVIEEKMAYNADRPYKHGKRF